MPTTSTIPRLFLGFAAWDDTEIDAGAELIGTVIAKSLRGR